MKIRWKRLSLSLVWRKAGNSKDILHFQSLKLRPVTLAGSIWERAISLGVQSSSEERIWNTSQLLQIKWTLKCSLQGISAHRVQNVHPRVITSLSPCSPIFGAQSCLVLSKRICRVPVQPQKSISAGMADSKFTASRRKKIRKPGLFKVTNFASWVQLLMGGRRLKENQSLSACNMWVVSTLTEWQYHYLVWHRVSWYLVWG